MNLKAFAAGLLLAVPALLEAQTVTYSLPQTTVTVEVDAIQESFFAGPYAAYAKRFLGIDVRETDASRSYVKEVRLVTRVEADPQAVKQLAELVFAPDVVVALHHGKEKGFPEPAGAHEEDEAVARLHLRKVLRLVHIVVPLVSDSPEIRNAVRYL